MAPEMKLRVLRLSCAPSRLGGGGVGQGVGQNDLGLGQVDLIRTAEKLDSDATHGMPPLFKADIATLSLLLTLSSRELSSQEPYQRCRALCANPIIMGSAPQ